MLKRNPSTGQPLYEIAFTHSEEVDLKIKKAGAAFSDWSLRTPLERGRILLNAAKLLRENASEFARTETVETGKPITESLSVDIPSAAETLEYYAGIAPAFMGESATAGRSFYYTRREPFGVCALIGAWNYPLQIACWKSAPALAAGNTVVYKPSELTPATAQKLEEIFLTAGLPDGVFNVIVGDGVVGEQLLRHPLVAKASLTGSVATGQRLMATVASRLTPLTLELGGKSPLIIFGDTDLDEAVDAAMTANFYTQGEICSNGTRVFVEKKRMGSFLEKLAEKTNRLVVGDPLDPETQVGALISDAHYRKVLSYIDRAKSEGAKLLCGGGPPSWSTAQTHLEKGYFVLPTVFHECEDSMQISREEVFGPVMTVLSFDDESEVVRRANDTPFGLAAGVFTQDIRRAHRVASQLRVGVCWINQYNLTPPGLPFGGVGLSGFGRENAFSTLEHYTFRKTVYVEMDRVLPMIK